VGAASSDRVEKPVRAAELVALFLSESETLFGLRTRHYSSAAVIAIVAEGAAVLLLTPVLAGTGMRALRGGKLTSAARGPRSPRASDRASRRGPLP
jgi:hypothetical protein